MIGSYIKFVLKFISPAFAAILLGLLVFINWSIWPQPWPDEALFSSPAFNLATRGIFATTVLAGLIPGMEQATLWNSPLYMVLLSGLYRFTGESLIIARGLSFFFGALALFSFQVTARKLMRRKTAFALSFLLVCDLSFSRAANTGRMDMLTVLFYLLALQFWVTFYQSKSAQKSQLALAAGLCTGLAAISHPAAFLLAPIALLFSLPSLRYLALAIVGALPPLMAWFVYIISYFNFFQIQFLSQLGRKANIVGLWGGDTGGIFKVYLSQYGGTAPVMVAMLLLIVFSLIPGILYLIRKRQQWKTNIAFRLIPCYYLILVLVLLASEAWYAVYIGPLLLLVAGYLFESRRDDRSGSGLLLYLLGFVFVCSTIWFMVRHHLWYDTPAKISKREGQIISQVKSCRSIYLRTRPDPYFVLRKTYPDMEILQFVPGKLRVSCAAIKKGKGECVDRAVYLRRKYNKIDCFLLDGFNDWEPMLSGRYGYLHKNKNKFRISKIPGQKPLASVFLYQRQ